MQALHIKRLFPCETHTVDNHLQMKRYFIDHDKRSTRWTLGHYVLSCQSLTFLSLPSSCAVCRAALRLGFVMAGVCQNAQPLRFLPAEAREFISRPRFGPAAFRKHCVRDSLEENGARPINRSSMLTVVS